ncbi:SAM-dependent methyltransferase [Microtetraspora sp. AC03309]|nr:SAM-dependent methyltransferase [Microtetraspora sp. AC03309]
MTGTDGIDATRPSPARMYDYFLGGGNNFEIDRHGRGPPRRRPPLRLRRGRPPGARGPPDGRPAVRQPPGPLPRDPGRDPSRAVGTRPGHQPEDGRAAPVPYGGGDRDVLRRPRPGRARHGRLPCLESGRGRSVRGGRAAHLVCRRGQTLTTPGETPSRLGGSAQGSITDPRGRRC